MTPPAVTPKVAVLLATYNGAAHCESQITSILWQRDVDVHVYVRDDGSRDATRAIVARSVERYPDRVTMVDDGDVSTGSATGNFFRLLRQIDLADYDYVALADQDDVWTPDKLGRATGRLATEKADGYSSDLIAYDMAGNAAWMLYKAGQPADLDYLFQGGSAGCTYVLSRRAIVTAVAVLESIPALCPAASHDWILYAICRSRGLPWIHDASAEILYRQHGANDYGAKRGLADFKGKVELTRSRWYRNHILWMRNVVSGTADEERVLAAVNRGGARDRLWLIRNAARFRRTSAFVMRLRIAIALGMI